MYHNIKHVYAIGDSFAFGQGLKGYVPNADGFYSFNENLRKSVYSGIIAERLGIENYRNRAMPGSSNDRTCRVLFTDISKMIAEGINPESIFVIISITHSARLEIFNAKKYIYSQLITNWAPSKKDPEYNFWENYILYFDHIIENADRYLQQIISMQLFLEKNKVRYIMTDSMKELPEFYELIKSRKSSLSNCIDRVKYPDIDAFHSWACKQGFEPTPCHHANDAAHAAWAAYLLEYIEKEKLLEI